MTEYQCSPRFYTVHVTVTNVFLILVCAVCLGVAAASPTLRYLLILVSIVAFYSVWNAFVAKANPSRVLIGPEGVVFASYGSEHSYPRAELTAFQIREVGGVNKLFIRVNKAGLLRGRYWVDVFYFNDAKTLAKQLLDLEQEIHPDSLKSVARSGQPLRKKK